MADRQLFLIMVALYPLSLACYVLFKPRNAIIVVCVGWAIFEWAMVLLR